MYLDERLIIASPLATRPAMPFFHTCDGFYLQKVIDSGSLIPTKCPEYGEDLLYLFYGRPAYKKKDGDPSKLSFLMPVCFILDYNAVTAIRRIAPFDTGGFKEYNGFMHQAAQRDEYLLNPDKKSIEKFLGFFYESNEHYFKGRPKELVTYDRAHHQLESVHNIMKDCGKCSGDDRKYTIELQLTDPIPLDAGLLQAVILPDVLKDSLTYASAFNRWGVPMLDYETHAIASDQYYADILGIAKKFMTDQKMFV